MFYAVKNINSVILYIIEKKYIYFNQINNYYMYEMKKKK